MIDIKEFIKTVKALIWRMTKGVIIHFKYLKTKKERYGLTQLMNSEETASYIIKNRSSVARYGDGEFQMILNGLAGKTAEDFKVDSFQSYDKLLSEKLFDVLKNNSLNPGFLVCLPYPLVDSSVYRGYEKVFWEREWLVMEPFIKPIINHGSLVGDSTFTRFFLHRKDIRDYNKYLSIIKSIWDNQEVVFVEGRYSRLGVGNDLFDNAKSIQRVLCPPTDAFSRYSEIVDFLKTLDKKKLFLLALGHTATVLAYDLYSLGYWAIDLGHIDVEYEWFRMGAKKKEPIPHKYVNETKEGRITEDYLRDVQYEKQIIKVFN